MNLFSQSWLCCDVCQWIRVKCKKSIHHWAIRDSAPEICCSVGFKKQRNTSNRITDLYILVLLLRLMMDIKSEVLNFFFFLSLERDESLKWPGWNAATVSRSIFGAAGAVFGAHIFAVMWCINALSGAWAGVKRGLLSVACASSALSLHFLLESLCAELGAGRPGSCFVACGSLWRVYFWKSAEGVGL